MKFIPFEQPLQNGLVVRGLQSQQRGLPLLVFLHGNGFSAGVYMPMLEMLADHYDVLAIDLPGHGKSDSPNVFPGWNAVADMAHSAALETGLLYGRAVHGIGHSLGGALTLLSAYKHPEIYQSLVLLDPIVFPKRLLFFMRVIAALRLTSAFHPHVTSTRRRRNGWSSRQAAFDYLHGRKIFENWTDDALRSFTNYALVEQPDHTVRLACDPETEALFFSTLPDGLWRSLQGVSCNTAMIMGEKTYPCALKAARTADRLNRFVSHKIVAGGHCYMQENPTVAVGEIRALIDQS